ncbi:MAG: ketopantoate reductase family protein [Burkholderiales bacterium]
MTRIAIIGAGAIGSALGALLSRAGQDVRLIGSAAQVDAIRRDGLHVDGALGDFNVRIEAAEALDYRPDLACLTVKTQDVVAAVRANLAFLADVPLVTFQNGVQSDALVASVLPAPNIVSAVVNIHANYLTPGSVTLLYPGPLVIGRPFAPNDAAVAAIAAILRYAVPTRISDNIRGVHWLKLIVNLNNAFPALTNTSFHAIYDDPGLRQLAVQVMLEGVQVARRAGIRLESLPDTPAALIRLIGWLPLRLAALVAAAKARRMESRWPRLGSTLQSLRRKRPTEIDYLNGEVVRLGRELGVATPLNAILVDMVHQVERARPFWTLDALRAEIFAGTDAARAAAP